MFQYSPSGSCPDCLQNVEFSKENAHSAVAEDGCVTSTFFAAVAHVGSEVACCFHHSRQLKLGSTPSALAK